MRNALEKSILRNFRVYRLFAQGWAEIRPIDMRSDFQQVRYACWFRNGSDTPSWMEPPL